MMRFRVLLTIFSVALSISTYCSSLIGQELSEELEKEAIAIEGMLIAPCCWRQPVAVHYSPAADEVRAEIRTMLSDGLTRQEILDRFVAEHEMKILAKPPAQGFNLLAYFLPVLFLAMGAVIALVVVKKLRPTEAAEPKPDSKTKILDSDDEERIEKELWG